MDDNKFQNLPNQAVHFPLVYIVLVNWKGWKDTIECIKSLFKGDYKIFRVIVCDNFSNDNSLDYIEKFINDNIHLSLHSEISAQHICQRVSCKDALQGKSRHLPGTPVTLIQISSNKGFAAGNNVGLAYALLNNDFDYIWLVNNDTTVNETTLSSLISCASRLRDYDIFGSTIIDSVTGDLQAPGGGRYSTFSGRMKRATLRQALQGKLDYISAVSMLVSKKCLTSVGLLCEDYFLYFEELDYLHRAKAMGFQYTFVPESRIFHKGGASIGKGTMADYYALLNRYKFTVKYYPQNIIPVTLSLYASLLLRLLRGQYKRALMILDIIFTRGNPIADKWL